MNKNCLKCKKEFMKKSNCSKKNWKTAKFCSQSCANSVNSSGNQNRKGMKSSLETRAKQRKTNLERGIKPPIMFGKRPVEVGRKISAATKGIKRPNMTGEKHPNWKGNSPLKKLIRNSIEMVQWRKSVFERDNYTCRDCGEYGGRLNADHIKEFSLIMEDNKITKMDEAMTCAEMWSLDNGQTLCKSCHQEKTKAFIKRYWQNQFAKSPVMIGVLED